MLNSHDYRSGRRTSDRPYIDFDAYDGGPDRWQNRGGAMYDDRAYYDDISEQEDERYQQHRSYAARDREESLLHSALDRISRARREGKGNVNLTMEEMAALERRNGQRSEPPPPSSALVSPPATPAKSAKDKDKHRSGSRSSSSTSLKNQKSRKGSTSSLLFGSPSKSNAKAKASRESPSRKDSDPQALAYPQANMPPRESMIPGPNGVMYAPVAYFAPPSPELARAQPSDSRSSSKHSRRGSTPPETQPLPARYYRPESSSSNRSFAQEDADWYPAPSRTRSANNAQQWAAYDYDTAAPPMPAAHHGRRNVSGPPAPGHASSYPNDLRYAPLRRVPPTASPLSQQRSARGSSGSGLRRVETSSSDSSDGQGVQIDILEEPNGGYAIRQTTPLIERDVVGTSSTPAATATPVKSPARRRKGSKR